MTHKHTTDELLQAIDRRLEENEDEDILFDENDGYAKAYREWLDANPQADGTN